MDTNEIRQRADMLSRFFDLAPMKHTFAMEISFDSEGNARFEMPHQKEFQHAMGDTHGGVIATLIDNAGWFTAATRYENWVNTSEMTVRLHEPAKNEDLVAEGKVIRAGKRLCVTSMQVKSASGRLIATGTGTFVVSSKPIVVSA